MKNTATISELNELKGLHLKLKHYSSDTFAKGQIVDVSEDGTVTIQPTDSYIICNYFEDDPIVLVFEQNKQINTCQTYISFIDYKTSKIKIIIYNMNVFSNRRTNTRYPASLYATILGDHELETSYLSNISESGISLMSGAKFIEGDLIEVESNFKDHVFRFKSSVVWLRSLPTINEYGLCNISCEPDIKKIIKLIGDDLKNSAKESSSQ
jgi:PilZ domain